METRRDWYPITKKESEIQIEWSPAGEYNLRAKKRDKVWIYGSCKRADYAEFLGYGLIQGPMNS